MKRSRAGMLAVRAVNQYRRRDVLAYLGLRYYLHNSAARSDQWVRQVAPSLVMTRKGLPYFPARHFKDTSEQRGVEHRAMFIPGANEALAETALLDACSSRPRGFDNPACVFSYPLTRGEDRSGIFSHYVQGLRARHQAIVKACDAYPGGVVRYADIKRFYPSISIDLAMKSWKKHAGAAQLSRSYSDLGEKLIIEHGATQRSGENGLLTGPMFSHLVGNLVLRELDEEFSAKLPARYFRYVDDITLAGESSAVAASLTEIRGRLADIGFELHDDQSPKSMEVPAGDWLAGRHDYRDSKRQVSWMTLIGDLKRFLLANPTERGSLQDAFRGEGFRIPVRDYSSAVYERSFLARIRELAEESWFRGRSQAVSIGTLVSQAKWLRTSYEAELRDMLATASQSSGFQRKRLIPKLRYRAGRLAYLANPDTLSALADGMRAMPELYFHSVVLNAIATANLDQLLPLGTNAAQAAAQPIRAAGIRCRTTLSAIHGATEQAFAIFRLNGIEVEHKSPAQREATDLMRFAAFGADIKLMKSNDHFMRELACLHGLSQQPRHPEFLESVFDEDETLAIDAVDQLQSSLSP